MPYRFRLRVVVPALALLIYGGASRAESVAAVLNSEVEAHFDAWDADDDAKLTLAELDIAVADPTVKGKTAGVAVALRRAARMAGPDAPLTRDRISKLLATPTTKPSLATKPTDEHNDAESDPDAPTSRDKPGTRLDTLYKSAMQRIEASSHRKLFGDDGPTLGAIDQGKIGDCFCLAPLGSMAHHKPAQLVERIKENADGTYTVLLGKDAIVVAAPTDGELALSNAVSTNGIWVNVYEKAVGISRQKKDDAGKLTSTPIATASRGGSAGTQLAALTGNPIKRFSCAPFRDAKVSDARRAELLGEFRTLVIETQAAERLMVCGTGAGVKVPGVTSNHAYAVLGYDATADAITLWNPHANNFTPKSEPGLSSGYPTKAGVFTVPLKEVVMFIGGFSFEQPAEK